jgi:transposase InsO family protein
MTHILSKKFNIRDICRVLRLARSSFYYRVKAKPIDVNLEQTVIKLFKNSRYSYGTRKLKMSLSRLGFKTSRTKISAIMKKYNLVSKYTKKRYKLNNASSSMDGSNLLNRQFNEYKRNEVLVSDVTYVRVSNKFNYLCVIIDLFSRKIVGSSIGAQHNAELVIRAFQSMKINLNLVKIFHSDRGSEFNNIEIDRLLKKNEIARSLSKRGNPIDNAVVESTYNIIKTELIKQFKFDNLEKFELKWFDYLNWYNNHRIHGSIGYKTPNEKYDSFLA